VIQLTQELLRQLQANLLELIVEVDRICKKCGIKFLLVGGTALGAARHKGFIPWDDDADIGFLRPEYEKFREACETELDKEKFYFQDHRNTEGYRWGYGKLRLKNTKFVRHNQEFMPYEQGVFVDIFPFDNVPDNYLLRCMHSFKCFLYRKTFWSKVGKKQARGFEKIAYKFLYLIPDKMLYSCFNKFVKKSNAVRTGMVRILTFPAANSQYGYYRKWYEELTEIEFDGKKFPIAKDYDNYLRFRYNGDYMKLPKPENRKTHPVSELKLIEAGNG